MRALPRRRCCLSVPGGSDKMLAKAIDLEVDELVFDLEDGVAIGEKEAARGKVVAALSSDDFSQRTISVRINAIGTKWCHDDIIALGTTKHPALTLIAPKVESAGDLAFLERLLLGVEVANRRGVRIGLQALIETASGLANIASIAAASPRLQSLIIGYGDLASSLGRSPRSGWSFAQDAMVVAARSNGLQAIDGPFFAFDTGSQNELLLASQSAAQVGFDGKWAIHPSQIASIESAFTPSDAELARARAIIAQLDQAQDAGAGVSTFEGAMIDEAMRAGAERILARTEERSWV